MQALIGQVWVTCPSLEQEMGSILPGPKGNGGGCCKPAGLFLERLALLFEPVAPAILCPPFVLEQVAGNQGQGQALGSPDSVFSRAMQGPRPDPQGYKCDVSGP